jgi:hypothetical protein
MFHFLQTQQGLYATAILAPITIIVAFIIFACRQERNKKVFVFNTPNEDYSLLTAQNWVTIISDSIEYSTNLKELERTMDKIEAFRTKQFRFRISKAERRNLIDNLLVLYCEKEIELQTPIAVELCLQ